MTPTPTQPMRQKIWQKMKPRPEVVRFSKLMELQLQNNEHRGGWSHCDAVYFLEKITMNLQDLKFNLESKSFADAARDCADIGNFSMMLEQLVTILKHVERDATPPAPAPETEKCGRCGGDGLVFNGRSYVDDETGKSHVASGTCPKCSGTGIKPKPEGAGL